MTAFADFIDLRTAVVEHVGNAGITDVFPRFVRLAEAMFNRELRLRQQITTATVTFSEGVAALPDDFAEMIGVFDGGGCEYLMQGPQSVQSGGEWYAVEGNSLFAPLIDGELSIKYYAEIPALGMGPTDSNWLLLKYPTLYLYAVSLEAAKHQKDAGLAEVTNILMQEAIMDACGDDTRARYARARVRVAGPTP